ncbi:MAG: hypothetical protein JAZ18_13770 [Candidatus Thiodiazotropha endolucinida]|nr:hypothetical protein [Candidatus Thiodiazotropha endolucinida]
MDKQLCLGGELACQCHLATLLGDHRLPDGNGRADGDRGDGRGGDQSDSPMLTDILADQVALGLAVNRGGEVGDGSGEHPIAKREAFSIERPAEIDIKGFNRISAPQVSG